MSKSIPDLINEHTLRVEENKRCDRAFYLQLHALAECWNLMDNDQRSVVKQSLRGEIKRLEKQRFGL